MKGVNKTYPQKCVWFATDLTWRKKMGKSVGRKNTAVINAEATNKMSKTVRLILGDQLNSNHSWFNTVDESVVYVMMEVRSETDYAKHIFKKSSRFFAAMQAFIS
jgi:hypothetical protein